MDGTLVAVEGLFSYGLTSVSRSFMAETHSRMTLPVIEALSSVAKGSVSPLLSQDQLPPNSVTVSPLSTTDLF